MTTSACPDARAATALISRLLIDRFEVSADAVQPTTRMGDVLVDSLMVVEMAIALHDTFGVGVEEHELRDLTVGGLAERIAARRAEA